MNEIDTLKRAIEYIDKMANGTNPLTDEDINEDDILNNVRISRCLFYVNGILRDVLDEKLNPKENMLSPLVIDEKVLDGYIFSDNPISLTVIAKKLSDNIDLEKSRKVKYKDIADLLIEDGALVKEDDGNHKKTCITDKGISIGISYTDSFFNGISRKYIVYNIDAQKYILNLVKTAYCK